MPNCRKGDLAIIVVPYIPENLGTFVEVSRVYKPDPLEWWVRSLGGPRLKSDGTIGTEATVADSGLRPIRGSAARAKRTKARKCAAISLLSYRM